jgi:hypothetical protein
MCRTKELGGRRCPQHTDPIKHAAYNARRRELYAARKPQKSASTNLYEFPPVDAFRSFTKGDQKRHEKESEKFAATIVEGYNLTEAKEGRWNSINSKNGCETSRAFIQYTSSSYRALRDFNNPRLKDDKYAGVWNNSNKDNSEKLQKITDLLDAALAKAEKPDAPRRLWRGMQINLNVQKEEIASYLEERFPVGGVISQGNFMSTSMDAQQAIAFSQGWDKDYNNTVEHSILLEILSREGAPLGYATSVFNVEEAEILVPRNARFKVVSIDHNQEVEYETSSLSGQKGKSKASRTVIRLIDAVDEADVQK